MDTIVVKVQILHVRKAEGISSEYKRIGEVCRVINTIKINYVRKIEGKSVGMRRNSYSVSQD